jgi:hypothetical protein
VFVRGIQANLGALHRDSQNAKDRCILGFTSTRSLTGPHCSPCALGLTPSHRAILPLLTNMENSAIQCSATELAITSAHASRPRKGWGQRFLGLRIFQRSSGAAHNDADVPGPLSSVAYYLRVLRRANTINLYLTLAAQGTVPKGPPTPMTPGSPSRSAGETSGAPAGLTTLPPAHTAAIIGVSSSTLLDEKLEADNPGWRADEELWLNAPVSPHVLVVSLLRMPVSLCKEPRGNPTNEDEEEAAGGGGSASHSSRALVSKKRCAGSYSPSADDEESDASTFDGNDSPLASEDKTLGTTGPSTGKYKLPALKLYPRKESRSVCLPASHCAVRGTDAPSSRKTARRTTPFDSRSWRSTCTTWRHGSRR